MIRAIKLPADPDKRAVLVELEATDGDAYRDIVGGPLKAIELRKPSSTLYVNREGKYNGLRLNASATALSWVHSSDMRGHHIIVGDALLVGPFDRRTYERSAPRYYRNLIFHEGKVTVEYRRSQSRRWIMPNITFKTWEQAYQYGAEFMHQTPDVTELRVVPLDKEGKS